MSEFSLHKKYILFDLDGTLVDSEEGIINSVVYSLRRLGIDPPSRETLKCFIGPPLYDSYSGMFGMSRAEAENAVSVYREYYRDRGVYECRVYDGIPQLLDGLLERGLTPVLATSKPTIFARSILERFGLLDRFAFVSGAELDGRRVDKAEVIEYAFDGMGIACRDALMVGDRRHDVEGAKSNGIPCIGVLYGFGSREELEAAGAAAIAEDVSRLEKLLYGRSIAL